MSPNKGEELLQKYLDGKCTPEEMAMLESWYNETSNTIKDLADEPDYKRVHQLLEKRLEHRPVLNQFWPHLAAAASIAILFSIGAYFYIKKPEPVANRSYATDIAPGSNHSAVLILTNGKRINLAEASDGELATENGMKITKTKDGQLIYSPTAEPGQIVENKESGSTSSINTIQTPRGGKYQVKLPDGSSVWLNSASTLKYPMKFNPMLRIVELQGEAYFEVLHNSQQPFVVKVGNKQITVLGTHFNVNGYLEETATKVTLLQGSVKVSSGKMNKLLKPGEQARMVNSSVASIMINKVETRESIDWKNDEFIFGGEQLDVIMRKISRWYDVEIIYQNELLKKEVFVGSISRFTNVSQVLDMLMLTGTVHFKIETVKGTKERRILVMN